MYEVFIEGLEFYAYHGASDEEQVVGHRYRVCISLTVNGTAPESDRVEDTVDYGAVAAIAESVVTGAKHRTVERLAQVLGTRLLAEFAAVDEASLRISKIAPPFPQIAEEAGVTMSLRR